MAMTIDEVMELAPMIPVLVIETIEDGMLIAEALVAGGLSALEVTLRTPVALEAIREMTKVPGAVVGAGTVLNPRQLDAALEAGAQFAVSPGLTQTLGEAAIDRGVAFLPGTSSASDIMRGMDLGLDRFKFFPAETSGGTGALKALAGPFRDARFCPTGGIRFETASVWLAEPAVKCVGGSWVVPKGPLDRGRIEALARAAAALRSRQSTS